MKHREPKPWSRRFRAAFLLLPKTLHTKSNSWERETRWLKRAEWVEEYYMGEWRADWAFGWWRK